MAFYFANLTTGTRDFMASGHLGYIDTPKQGNKRPAGVAWCADTGALGTGLAGRHHWWAWLTRHADDAPTCVFATAPDVVTPKPPLSGHIPGFLASAPSGTRRPTSPRTARRSLAAVGASLGVLNRGTTESCYTRPAFGCEGQAPRPVGPHGPGQLKVAAPLRRGDRLRQRRRHAPDVSAGQVHTARPWLARVDPRRESLFHLHDDGVASLA